MSQEPRAFPAPAGVVYNTTMARADAALALGALYVSASRREARVGGICVSNAGLDAAIFCDIVARFYTGQSRTPSSNAVLPIGFAAASPPTSAPMVETVVAKKREDGAPRYVRSIHRIADTGQPEALLRNAVTFSAETVVILSAPATALARSVELAGTIGQYKQRVKRVMIVDAGGASQDAAALSALVAALPVPVIFCGHEIGDALSLPLSRVENGFTWASANPVLDACRASGESTIALNDVAALYYAIHPASGFFTVSDSGPTRRLVVESAKTEECAAALVALATSKPSAPPARGG